MTVYEPYWNIPARSIKKLFKDRTHTFKGNSKKINQDNVKHVIKNWERLFVKNKMLNFDMCDFGIITVRNKELSFREQMLNRNQDCGCFASFSLWSDGIFDTVKNNIVGDGTDTEELARLYFGASSFMLYSPLWESTDGVGRDRAIQYAFYRLCYYLANKCLPQFNVKLADGQRVTCTPDLIARTDFQMPATKGD